MYTCQAWIKGSRQDIPHSLGVYEMSDPTQKHAELCLRGQKTDIMPPFNACDNAIWSGGEPLPRGNITRYWCNTWHRSFDGLDGSSVRCRNFEARLEMLESVSVVPAFHCSD